MAIMIGVIKRNLKLQIMSYKISKFRKSDHFSWRQWDRGISDSILTPILSSISPRKDEILYIVSRKRLKQIDRTIDQELFIKINGKVLVTCFYCSLPEYLGKKRTQNYVIID